TATHFIYLEVSGDRLNYGFIRRTSATQVIFQPQTTTTITGTFAGIDVPPEDRYYRIRMYLLSFPPCGSGQYYSPGYLLCGLGTPTVVPTVTRTLTPTPTSCAAAAPYPVPIAEEAAAAQGSGVYTFGGLSSGGAVANSYRYD